MAVDSGADVDTGRAPISDTDVVARSLDLYAATFDLMVDSRKPTVVVRMQRAYGDLHDAVKAHAPWAMPELNNLLLALAESIRLLQADQQELDRARRDHATALLSLRRFLADSSPPWP